MAFVKGKSGNPNGRGKGSKNKATILLEERRADAYELVDKVLQFVKEQMNGDDEAKKLKAIDKLSPILPFILPKLSSIDANVKTDNTISSIVFERVTKKGTDK
jgi:hypothetical protein